MNIPNHIGFIMDGNGRWATARLMPRSFGHKKGAEAMKRVVNACIGLGVKYCTVYAFSTENWKRPQAEINALFSMIRDFMSENIDKEFVKPVRIITIGNIDATPEDVREKLRETEERTKNNDEFTLLFAFNYGGREEIVRACNRLLAQGKTEIDEKTFSSSLDTAGVPDPDVIVRTSGEKRLSNFLLWQAAYSELIFIDTLWPDMTDKDVKNIIEEYNRRNRKFGGV